MKVRYRAAGGVLGDEGAEFCGVGKLRHALRRDEGGHLDGAYPGLPEAAYELVLVLRRNRGCKVLETVARTDVADLDLVRVARDQFGYRQMFLHHVIDETRFSRPILNSPRAAVD